jgi:hypothetical protein
MPVYTNNSFYHRFLSLHHAHIGTYQLYTTYLTVILTALSIKAQHDDDAGDRQIWARRGRAR